jgi:protease-4
MSSPQPQSSMSRPKEIAADVVHQAKKTTCSVLRFCLQNPRLALFGGLALSSAIQRAWKTRIRSNTILELDLSACTIVHHELGPLDQMFEPMQLQARTILEALHHAIEDDRIVGIVLKMGISEPFELGQLMGSWGFVEEMRECVLKMRQQGKMTVFYSQSLVGFPALVQLFLATAFESVFLSPLGELLLTGQQLDAFFLKGTFEKLDMDVEMRGRGKYKTAIEQFTRDSLSAESREQLTRLQASILDTVADSINKGPEEGESKTQRTQISREQFFQIMANGPYSAQQAKDIGLISDVMYRDQIYENFIPEKLGKKKSQLNFLYTALYRSRKGFPFKPSGLIQRAKIAFIPLFGPVVPGAHPPSFASPTIIAEETTCLAIRSALKDPKVKVLLLHLHTRGGDSFSTDTIARELRVAREKGIKIVVSMGEVCASAGYWLAAEADYIFALPTTITGSIGVFGGKNSIGRTINKIGMTTDTIKTSENAGIFSAVSKLGELGERWLDGFLDRAYDAFKSVVSERRGMSMEEVEALAQGQVYTGLEAKENGLVDELGGYLEAVEKAKQLAATIIDRPQDAKKIGVEKFPKPPTLKDVFFADHFAQNDEERASHPSNLPAWRDMVVAGGRALQSIQSISHVAATLQSFQATVPGAQHFLGPISAALVGTQQGNQLVRMRAGAAVSPVIASMSLQL